jgi:transcriptional regulator with XRE-family HTH domain/Zn-dependent peptidase ImmA (M78 family)
VNNSNEATQQLSDVAPYAAGPAGRGEPGRGLHRKPGPKPKNERAAYGEAAVRANPLAVEVGKRIRELRRQKHITQKELASRMGMRPGPMNLIEKGRHVPSGRLLYRLSSVLEVPIDEFFPREPYATSGSAPMAVREGTIRSEDSPAYGLKSRPVVRFLPVLDTAGDFAALDMANDLARAFLSLEDLCGAMKSALIPLHIPFVATESGVEQLVCQSRHHLGITNAVVFDYLELMENAGLRVVFAGFPGGTQSLVGLDAANANAFLFVRSGMNPERQLFRMVFELGRIYWHMRMPLLPQGLRNRGEDLDELHMARKFAALFLMPAVAVRATVGQLGIGPDNWTYELLLRVKHRFGASAESFAIRLEELGLIEPALSAGFKQRIREHYKATDWGEPDGSMRRLSHNGRLGDLLMTALGREKSREEAREIERLLAKHGLKERPTSNKGGGTA